MREIIGKATMKTLFIIVPILGAFLMNACTAASADKGPLRVLAANPRYFTDNSGKAIYLTGAHTWADLQDMDTTDPPKPFDFNAYLDFLEQHHHNFIRLWRWELPRWTSEGHVRFCTPQPWLRSGPALDLDGKPQFDLTHFDPAYFKRLKDRVAAAQTKGIFVSIMLFEGYGLQFGAKAWPDHPFHPDNNINAIPGNVRDGNGLQIYELANPAITAIQEAYVRKVIDTVNGFDNVLYEISNENHAASTDWQYHMIRFIKKYEAAKPKQHPVGMTFQYAGGKNATLFASPADWISPNPDGGYRDDPPASDGKKVILSDTDHLWGEGGTHQWVWKSFLRGMNVLYMDRIVAVTGNPSGEIPNADDVRNAMGVTRKLADRIDLAHMTPHNTLASTGYCLANPGKEYLVYAPEGGRVTVDLSAAKGPLSVEWVQPIKGTITPGTAISGGAKQDFTAPWSGDAVLHIKAP
jgi:hypothetical protein